MEKVMSIEEKIRKAEEIYNRRSGNTYNTYLVKNKKKNPSFTKRLVKQLIICLLIYGIFYVVTNREYFLSEEFKTKLENISAKNEILNKTYQFIMPHIEKYFNKSENINNIDEKTEEEKNKENETISTNDENIGGKEIETEQEQTEIIETEEKTQEEQDIEYVKNNINFILPIEGRISSTFGWRNPTTVTVPKYHTGLDILER